MDLWVAKKLGKEGKRKVQGISANRGAGVGSFSLGVWGELRLKRQKKVLYLQASGQCWRVGSRCLGKSWGVWVWPSHRSTCGLLWEDALIG